MAILNTYTYSPEIARLMDESFEMAGMSPKAVGADHIDSFFRSMEMMLNSEWSTLGVRDWMVVRTTQALTAADASYDLPAGAVEMLGAMYRNGDADTPLFRISREDYLDLHDKTIEGRPDRFWVEKLYDRVRFTLWRVPDRADTIVYDYLRQLSDVGTMSNTLHMPVVAHNCFVHGMAMRLAFKFTDPARYAELKLLYGGPRYPEQQGGLLMQLKAASASGGDLHFSFARRRR